jgi:hypothetical protein
MVDAFLIIAVCATPPPLLLATLATQTAHDGNPDTVFKLVGKFRCIV